MNRFFQLLVFTTFLIGCGKAEKHSSDAAEPAVFESKTEAAEPQRFESNEQQLVKTASLRLKTGNSLETYRSIKAALNKFGASISEENSFDLDNRKGYDLIIRVPKANFEQLLRYITSHASIKNIEHQSIRVNDITEEFIDTKARIKVKKQYKEQLLALLRQSRTLTETLEIQKQLSALQEETESIEGRMKYLANQVEYSTIEISVYENRNYSKQFFSDIRDALSNGWQVFLYSLTLLANLWVIIFVLIAAFFGYTSYKRGRNRGKTDQ